MFYTDEKLHKYALPLSQTEKENCESTIHVVTDLLLKFGLKFTRKRKSRKTMTFLIMDIQCHSIMKLSRLCFKDHMEMEQELGKKVM